MTWRQEVKAWARLIVYSSGSQPFKLNKIPIFYCKILDALQWLSNPTKANEAGWEGISYWLIVSITDEMPSLARYFLRSMASFFFSSSFLFLASLSLASFSLSCSSFAACCSYTKFNHHNHTHNREESGCYTHPERHRFLWRVPFDEGLNVCR